MFSNDDKLASAEIQEEVSKCYPDAKPAMLKVRVRRERYFLIISHRMAGTSRTSLAVTKYASTSRCDCSVSDISTYNTVFLYPCTP